MDCLTPILRRGARKTASAARLRFESSSLARVGPSSRDGLADREANQ